MISESAGLLLYRLSSGKPEVLLVHPGGPFWVKRDEGAWTIPKGEIQPGEDAQAAALREFREELGAPPRVANGILTPLSSVRQKGGKVVQAWAAEGDFDPVTIKSNTFSLEWPPRSGGLRNFPEVDRAAWFDLDVARLKINSAQAAFLDGLERLLAPR